MLGNSQVYLNNEMQEGIVTGSRWSNCVGFDLTKLEVEGSGLTGDDLYAEIYADWTTSETASEDINYFDHVAVYIADEEPTESSLSFLYVPFTRYLASEDQFVFSYGELTIGKTTKRELNGDLTNRYPPLILSRSTFTMANEVNLPSTTSSTTSEANSEIAYGQLALALRQGSFSRTFIKEISPLDLGNFLGNIGGFWELLIVFWGLVFIATGEDREPKLKARNFTKSIRVGRDIITRRRSLSVDSSASVSRTGERPYWESALRGNQPNSAAAAAGIPATQSANGSNDSANSVATRRASNFSEIGNTGSGHQQSADGSSSSFRRPVVRDVPRRRSGSGGVPPASDEPALPSYETMTSHP
ncbi:unnamed protein product [Scytosiphon promiscuus]